MDLLKKISSTSAASFGLGFSLACLLAYTIEFRRGSEKGKKVEDLFAAKEKEDVMVGDPSIKSEQLSRIRQFFGDEGQNNIEKAFVIVVGVGGVGSHAANMLVRSGVGRIRIIDFDQVSLSSLNRHATATQADVGTPKVFAMKNTFRCIAPWCKVEALKEMFMASKADELLSGNPDIVVDCIDDKETKTALLQYCQEKGIRVLCSLGAGGKADPTKLLFSDLNYVQRDPLGNTIRQNLKLKSKIASKESSKSETDGEESSETNTPTNPLSSPLASFGSSDSTSPSRTNGKGKLRKEKGAVSKVEDPLRDPSGIICLYSHEEVRAKLLPLELDETKGETPQDFGALDNFRVRVIPVLGTSPAIFGMSLASWVLCYLAGEQHAIEASAVPPLGSAGLTRLQSRFGPYEIAHYPKGFGWGVTGGLGLSEIEFLVNDIWHQRCPFRGGRINLKNCILQLARFRPWKGSVPSNVVLIEDTEAELLVEHVVNNEEIMGLASDIAAIVPHDDIHDASKLSPEVRELHNQLETKFRDAVSAIWGCDKFDFVNSRLQYVRSCGWM